MLEADEVSRQMILLLYKIKGEVFVEAGCVPGECFRDNIQWTTDSGQRTKRGKHE